MTSIETLRAVHHPTRRRIMEHLYLHGPAQVGTLAGDLDEQVGSISHHLRMLERAGVVARVPELATDGRTSWWRLEQDTVTWSADDFTSAADRTQAKAAERLNIDHQLAKLSAWKREADRAGAAWRRAAFSTDFLAVATPAELEALQEALQAAVRDWRASIDPDDGAEREPVFVFTHGFPTRP
ncbi:ArsR family transcriptional regulator [Nocardioides sp. YIM 152315]|uniref:ArsR/SmtB family transcription factor n=1 Tax=Nocardioides sp. YIM 152315 TaxID=3031760 RepID=UPI0023DB05E4|nr:ArsR family transcriptional regulator [Nocardioides sp. YIM 152315]MDF1605359.1 helix-turn-helix domain-containing protein [Nocardioides sp. YIM 152315]